MTFCVCVCVCVGGGEGCCHGFHLACVFANNNNNNPPCRMRFYTLPRSDSSERTRKNISWERLSLSHVYPCVARTAFASSPPISPHCLPPAQTSALVILVPHPSSVSRRSSFLVLFGGGEGERDGEGRHRVSPEVLRMRLCNTVRPSSPT
jgi:hypothetical protein